MTQHLVTERIKIALYPIVHKWIGPFGTATKFQPEDKLVTTYVRLAKKTCKSLETLIFTICMSGNPFEEQLSAILFLGLVSSCNSFLAALAALYLTLVTQSVTATLEF